MCFFRVFFGALKRDKNAEKRWVEGKISENVCPLCLGHAWGYK